MSTAADHDARPRVLILVPSLRGGGSERVAVNVLNHCNPERINISMGVLDPTGQFADEVDPAKLAVASLRPDLIRFERGRKRNYRLTSLAAAAALGPANVSRLISAAHPDVVISFVKGMCIATQFALMWPRRKRPVWIAREGTAPHSEIGDDVTNALGRAALATLLARCYRAADCLLTCSYDMGADLAPKLRIDPKRIRTIHNPIDLDRVRAAANDRTADAPRRPFIVTAGRLEYQKGYDMLLRAFARSRAQEDVDLVILGQGSQDASLRQLAGELGLSERVHFRGFVENPWAYFAQARLFVLSSRWEGFGNVIPEAMACGCPVLVADCDYGPREVVTHGEDGWLIPSGDEDALSLALDELLDGPDRLARLADAGERRALDFNVDAIVSRYADLFEELAGRFDTP